MAAGLISTAVGAGTALISDFLKNRQTRKLNNSSQNILTGMLNENKAWYDVKKSQDYTARTDVQAAINRQRQILDEQYRNARATNVVAGGTDAQLALQKEAANRSLAQTTTDVAANASNWHDSNEDKYRAQDMALKQQQIQTNQQQAQAIAQAGSQAVSSGIGLVGQGVNLYELDKAGVLQDVV